MADQDSENDLKAKDDNLAAETERIMLMLDPEGERAYDLHHQPFEMLVDFFGWLATVTVVSHIKPQFDPVELLQFYTELFLKPEILHEKYSEEIDRILLIIASDDYEPYTIPALLEDPGIPLQLRENCIRATFTLHERLLTVHHIESTREYWSELCHLRVGRKIQPQDTESYPAQSTFLQGVVFETLVRIIEIDSVYCQHTALRALHDLQNPDTKPLVEAFLQSHPDLNPRERSYALAVTQDVLYDISEATFDEFVDFLFAHHAYEGMWEFDPVNFDPIRTVRFYIQLFNDPAFLFQRFSREQLENGFWQVQSCNLEIAAGHLLGTGSIPLDLRLDFIRAMYNLYKYFFSIDPLENSCFMWWDGVTSDTGVSSKYGIKDRIKEDYTAIRDTMFETLGNILELDSPCCRSAALHGLGHLGHPDTETLIHKYLDAHPELDRGTRAYALASITGDMM